MKTKTQDGRPFCLEFETGQRYRNTVEILLFGTEHPDVPPVTFIETIALSDAIQLRYELDAVIRAAVRS